MMFFYIALCVLVPCGFLFVFQEAGEKIPALGIVILFGLLSVPMLSHALAMRGAAQGKKWGCYLSKVLGVGLLFAFPVGTLIGIYILIRSNTGNFEFSDLAK